MGSAHSTEIKKELADLAPTSSSDAGSNNNDNNMWVSLDTKPSFDDSSDDDDESDGEDDLAFEERLRILEDSRKLRMMAEFFLHPEKPVKAHPVTSSRCYFERASAPQHVSWEESNEAAQIQREAMALKKLAVDYMHPEIPLESAIACSRCYFERASAPEQELDEGEAEAREQILAEMRALKKAAYDYLHPEAPITTEAIAFGRNYFSRYSASEFLTKDEALETELILKDAKLLSEFARNTPIKVEPMSMGRNYFDRPSAPQRTTLEEEQERQQILKEAAALKQLAIWFMHPEKPVEVDATACARNYFSRASAPEQEEEDYCDDRDIVIEEMKELKHLASDYLHPEKPLVIDATACACNYFGRPSHGDQEEEEYADEREIILEEMQELKQLASDFLHPEKPVEMKNTAARCYFDRPSAPEPMDMEERDRILQDMKSLKKFAVWYMHPEMPVEVNATACARNYFSRASAPEQEEDEFANERAVILKEAILLKQKAVDFMHPELPVQTDPAAFGRNYFDRPSAADYEDDEYASNHEMVHMDAAMLYRLAVDYRHPERPVKTNPAAFGRNYFNRPSAPQQEEDEYAEERVMILKDAAKLKEKAVDFLHPELPLLTTDPTIFGRNYFNRPAAFADSEDVLESYDEEEREHILSDAHHLERLAMEYHHPEQPVQSKEEMETARNYYESKFHQPHHTHFDLDDDIHLHHAEFDRNTDHHHEVTELRVTTPSAARNVIKDFDFKFVASPGCVMTFTNARASEMPELPMSPGCVSSFAHPAGEHWHPELPSLS